MDSKDYISKKVIVKIDRPLWSKHPTWDFVYTVNYWFIPWTVSGDWEELDAYVIWIENPVEEFEWICIWLIRRLDDDDDKLIVVPEWMEVSDDVIREKTNFQEQFFKSVIIR
jgi:inorganic pyrophosphatase